MSNNIQIPTEFKKVVDERSNVWNEYDGYRARLPKLAELVRKVDTSGPAENVQMLTSGQTPPEELVKSISALQGVLKEIDSAKDKIRAAESQIEGIKSRVMRIYMGGAVAVIGAITIVVLSLSTS